MKAMRDYDPTDKFGTMPEIPQPDDDNEETFEFRALEGAIKLLGFYLIFFIVITVMCFIVKYGHLL